MTFPKMTVLMTKQEEGMRVDRWFKAQEPQMPHHLIQKLLRCGSVRVDGRKVAPGYRLKEGDVVQKPLQSEAPLSDLPEKRSTTHVRDQDLQAFNHWLVYEDDRIAVINKPHGLAVQGGSRTFLHLDGILQKRAQIHGSERWLLVHRLDKDTGGLVVLAKNTAVARQLSYGFQKGWIGKTYWGISIGVPHDKEGVIQLPLRKTQEHHQDKVKVDDKGAQATSKYVVLDRSGTFAWLQLEPLTGRTHQLRVHCASLGTPLLGDGKYGGASAYPLGRTILHLHAQRIDLSFVWGSPLVVTAPLNEPMRQAFDQLGFDVRDGERM